MQTSSSRNIRSNHCLGLWKNGYDIQCQVVGETGTANLPEPASVLLRSEAKLSTEILVDWKDRFIDSYDVELQEWIHSTIKGEVHGPSAWDGYVVAVTSDACVQAKHSGEIVLISLPERPSFYDKKRVLQAEGKRVLGVYSNQQTIFDKRNKTGLIQKEDIPSRWDQLLYCKGQDNIPSGNNQSLFFRLFQRRYVCL